VADVEHWKTTDAASYDATAARFDELAERYSGPVADELLRIAQVAPRDRVLDVGAGTGLVALRAAQAAGAVTAVDHSQGMLDQAAGKARARGLDVAFARMDAESLGARDGAFDCVVSLFVLMHLPHPAKAVAEMHRVLAPGGRVVLGVGSPPPLASLAGLKAAVRRLTPQRELTAPRFLRELLAERGLSPDFGIHQHVDVEALLRGAGFRDIRSSWVGGSVQLEPEAFWEVQAVFGSEERVLLGKTPEAVRQALRTAFLERATAMRRRGGHLVYRYGAMIFRAEKA
jgi:ubiquinone/menaquinone biosynthesis C-methylase UbiE